MSPRSPEANDLLHEERRKTILDAALGVFVERGYEGTRMQEIADRCALSYGLVYHYFPTKEAIFATLVDHALAGAGTLLRALPQGSLSLAFVGHAVSDPSPQYFAILVEALTKKGVSPDLAAKARKAVLGLRDAIASAGQGAIPGEVDARAESIMAMLIGVSIMKVCGLSDGSFAYRALTTLAAIGRGSAHGKL
jgi:AcrR family transcriptional regulator